MDKAAKRRSALQGVYTCGRFGAEGERPGITMSERRGLGLVHIDTGGDGDVSGTSTGARMIKTGPGRYLAVMNEAETTPFISHLSAAHPDAALNIVSSSRTVLRVSGPAVRDVLASGCRVDLHPNAFPVGDAISTDIDHVVVIIDHVDEGTFDIFIPRGFAVSFYEWLIEQSAEVGGEVA